MSFSQTVKGELIDAQYTEPCCRKAFLYGMCLFGKSFSSRQVALQTENPRIAEKYSVLLAEICRVEAAVVPSPGRRSFTVSVTDGSDCAKILKTFAHQGAGSLRVNYANFDCENCQNAFIAGAFLSCGTVSSPKSDYHLEFTVPYQNLAASFVTMLEEKELKPGLTNRKGYHIMYFKGSEAIEDCLYLMGASGAMFEMMNVKIVKDIRNSANRKANCETANIERMVQAVRVQLDAIEKIRRLRGLDYLSEDLHAMARLREENPDSSLSELAEMSALSRSGVNHRLRRIVDIAAALDENV